MKHRWEWMAELCVVHGFKSGIELGVKEGRFSHYLASKKVQMYAVDLWKPMKTETEDYSEWPMEQYYEYFKSAVKDLPVMILRMDTRKAANIVPDVDFVFVDADHSYKAVKSDIEAYKGKCRFLCGHDYNLPSVKKAVDEMGRPVEPGPDNVWGVWM